MMRILASRVLFFLLLYLTATIRPALGQILPFGGERLKPKHDSITFWDDYLQDYRGMKILFYTLPQDRANREVDKRLHATMTAYLNQMADKVITRESYTDIEQQKIVENAVASLVDQWKLENKVSPDLLFQAMPSLDVDMIVFMERTHYDQVFSKEKKKLRIGVKLAAFELDLGEPLFVDQYYNELPWQGEQTSYIKVEQKALLQEADKLGEYLHKTAALINEAHIAEVKAAQEAEMKREEERLRQLKAANEGLAHLVKQAENTLKSLEQPHPAAGQLTRDIELMKRYLKIPVSQLTTEQEEERLKVAYSIEVALERLKASKAEAPAKPFTSSLQPEEVKKPDKSQRFFPMLHGAVEGENKSSDGPLSTSPSDSIEAQPIPSEVPKQPETSAPPKNQTTLKTLPSISKSNGNIHDRRWLLSGKQKETSLQSQAGKDPQFGAPTGAAPNAASGEIQGQSIPQPSGSGSTNWRMSLPLPSGKIRYATPTAPEE